MKQKVFLLLLLLFHTALWSVVLAQERTVSGSIISALDASPIVGATVTVKENPSIGTIAGDDGKFSLVVPADATAIVIRALGYSSETVLLSDSLTDLEIMLLEDLRSLSEVVVVGYGVQERRDITGAITTIKPEEMRKLQSTTLDAMLQGQGTGIQVNQASGVAGGGPVRVMIRGTATLSAGAEPLWVIDGIPISNETSGIGISARGAVPQNPLATINPNDIESIEVLKDAAATAIYGSRGANGVIIVTTKSGQADKTLFNVGYVTGATQLTRTPEDIGFVNGQQWLSTMNLARANSGLTTTVQEELSNPNNLFFPQLSSITRTNSSDRLRLTEREIAETNWFNQILRNSGSFQELNAFMSGGNNKVRHFISANYRNEKGVLINNDFERFTARANLDFEPLNNFKIGVKFNPSFTTNNRVMNGGRPFGNTQLASGGFRQAATESIPIFPVYDSTGSYFFPYSGSNLKANTDRSLFRDEQKVYRVLGGAYAEYFIPYVKGLSLRTEWFGDINYVSNIFYASANLRPVGTSYAEDRTSMFQNYNYNVLANFNRDFGTKHNINAVAGTESQRFFSRSQNLFGENIPGTSQDFGAPVSITRNPSAGLGGERYIRSYFVRGNYRLLNRYLLGASFRRDGVSIFTPENRWSNFSALSAGWIITEEPFVKSLLGDGSRTNENGETVAKKRISNILNFLKLRASFGQTGNQNIPPNIVFFNFANWPVYGDNSGSLVITGLPSYDVTWEVTNSYDVGLEFGLFKDRISGSFGYYRRNVSDLLFQVPTPPSVGLNFGGNSIWANVGDVQNQGVEFNITTYNLNWKGLQWKTTFNITTAHTIINSINPTLDKTGQGVVLGKTRNIAGSKLGAFFLAEYAGVDPQTGIPMIYEIDRQKFSETGQTVKTGNVIPATNANITRHRIIQDKTGLPTYFGGINNAFDFKRFEFSFLLTFQGGNYLYDNAAATATQAWNGLNTFYSDLEPNSWKKAGDVTLYPRLMWNNRHNIDNNGNGVFNADGTPKNNQNYTVGGNANLDRYLFKGDFMRLRSIQLAYNLPANWVSRAKLKGVRVFVSANNLLTFSKYKGWDPEQLNYSGTPQERNLGQGEVNNVLPQVKSYQVGFNVSF